MREHKNSGAAKGLHRCFLNMWKDLEAENGLSLPANRRKRFCSSAAALSAFLLSYQ
jgi:hypothetical protein